MKQIRTMGVLLLAGAIVLAAGCLGSSDSGTHTDTTKPFTEQPGGSGSVTASPLVCPPERHPEYRVVQGEPFTFTGTVPKEVNQSVAVYLYSQLSPMPYIWQPAVEPGGTYSFTVYGNRTQQDWEDYITYRDYPASPPISPYDHVCIKYSTRADCLDLLIVQDDRNLTVNRTNTWIRIDPLPDLILPESRMQNFTGNFFVNGTTNLPPGGKINLTISSTCFLPCPKTTSENIGCCGSSYEDVADIRAGPCGVDTWSFYVNTVPNRISVGRVNGVYGDRNGFLVMVSQANLSRDRNAWDISRFVIRSKEEVG